MQGEALEIPFNLSNVGNVSANDIVVSPVTPRSWEKGNWTHLVLPPQENISGTFPISPFVRAIPQRYVVPVDVFVEGGLFRVITETFVVSVIPRGDLKRLQVVEYPPLIQMPPNAIQDISFFVENVGDKDLEGIHIELQDSPCLERVTGEHDLEWREQKLMVFTFFSGEEGSCTYNIIFKDQEGDLVGFAPVVLEVSFESALQEQVKKVLLLLLSVWSALTIFVVMRRRRT